MSRSALHTQSLAKRLNSRLWKCGFALMVLLATLVAANFIVAPEKAISRKELGHDFLAFYTAGAFVRQGRVQDLYDLSKVRAFQHEISRAEGLETGESFGPYWNPPAYAWVFVPFSMLPYPRALSLWVSLQALALGLSMLLLVRLFNSAPKGEGLSPEEAYELRMTPRDTPPRTWRSWALIPIFIVACNPCLQALNHGQNTCTSLLLLTCAACLWRSRRAFLGGAVCGLLFYKPQLAAVIATLMVVDLGLSALAGMGLSLAAFAAVTFLAMPGSAGDYLHRLPANLHFMQVENTYLWERHVTLKGFFRLLLQGRGPGEPDLAVQVLTFAAMGAFAIAIGWAVLRMKAAQRQTASWEVLDPDGTQRIVPATDRLICAGVSVMPLLMPFYFDYDLLLLALPMTLFARETRLILRRLTPEPARAQPRAVLRAERLRADAAPAAPARLPPRERAIVCVFAAMYIALNFAPLLGKNTRVNLTPPLLAALSALFISRLGRPRFGTRLRTAANESVSDFSQPSHWLAEAA